MTENAFFWISTLVSCTGGYRSEIFHNNIGNTGGNSTNNSRSNNKLSYLSFKKILNQFGPRVLVNKVLSNGGAFLVEICRAKNVQESVILKCIKELIVHHKADVNIRSNESILSQQTALCVAAARGMSSIVQYLIQEQYADVTICCSGRFHLSSNRHKIIKFNNQTPYDFAVTMKNAELDNNCPEPLLKRLSKCIILLEKSQKE